MFLGFCFFFCFFVGSTFLDILHTWKVQNAILKTTKRKRQVGKV